MAALSRDMYGTPLNLKSKTPETVYTITHFWCTVIDKVIQLSVKPPVHVIHIILTPQLLGMATAVRAEPAKYIDKHHSV